MRAFVTGKSLFNACYSAVLACGEYNNSNSFSVSIISDGRPQKNVMDVKVAELHTRYQVLNFSRN